MPTPSLLIVPARFKTGRLYSQIPTANGDFTVTRNTEARRFNSAGLLESVASGIPRLDYYTSGGVTGCPALLVEPAATNLAFNSQTWDASNNWQLSDGSGRVTVATATSGTLAPDGTSTANAITPTSGNITHYLYSNASGSISYVSGTVYTISAFFKKGAGDSGRYIQIATANLRFLGNPYANFDLELGTTLTLSGSVADSNRVSRIENYGNGWYRCSLTATCGSAGSTAVGIIAVLLTADTNARAGTAFEGNTSDYIFGWGAQLETGSVATSYIPTTAGTGSRSADVISVSGAVSGSIGQTEGTIYAEVDISTKTAGLAGNQLIDILFDSDTRAFFRRQDGSTLFQVRLRVGGVNVVDRQLINIPAGVAKIALGYKSGDNAVYVNGTNVLTGAGLTNTFTIVNQFNKVDLGHISGSANSQFNDRIRAVALYTTRLTNAELATLTTP